MSNKFFRGSRNVSTPRLEEGQVSGLQEIELQNIRNRDTKQRAINAWDRPYTATEAGEVYPKKSNSITAGTLRPPTHLRSQSFTSLSAQSKNWAGRGMSGMLDTDRSRSRRERTFIGAVCAVCDEPLEHTLRGERIVQFSCGDVSHSACLVEFMRDFDSNYCPTCNAPLALDSSRGGNAFDIEKLSSTLRSASVNERSILTATPTTWDNQTLRAESRESIPGIQPQESGIKIHGESFDASARGHSRTDSEITGGTSSYGYPETTQNGPPPRRHDYDVQAMETTLISPRPNSIRNPIPPPSVSVRSEFPTINRSRQQQTLTCLITIEVTDNKWRPDPDDLRTAPLVPNIHAEEPFARPPSPAKSVPRLHPYGSPAVLDEVAEKLRVRVDNWHGLEFERFGKLRLYGAVRVGKDKKSWQELECYLFAEMLICVREKKSPAPQWDEETKSRKPSRCALKGSILIKKHLDAVTRSGSIRTPGKTEKISQANLQLVEENILTLSLSVDELPSFHLQFDDLNQLKLWQQALLELIAVEGLPMRPLGYDNSEEEDWQSAPLPKHASSANSSSYGAGRSATTAPTEYTEYVNGARNVASLGFSTPLHVPMDIVVVVPISSSMQGIKISLVRDALKFMVQNLGDRDRMGLVTFGSGGGGVPLVGMTTKAWSGWENILAQIKPVGQKSHRTDVVEGANVAMDLLMQRKSSNAISTILLVSDSSTSDAESVDFVVSRAEAAKITIHSFGLGMTHKPDTMIELSTRTKASYSYVKDWMMLRECLAGCLGALQATSHQNVKLKLRLPEGSPAKFVKISGALQITKRATGRDAEAQLGDLRFGDKRDILVQLVITPDNASIEQLPQDPWESIVSGLEALGGPLDHDDQRPVSIEEVPLIQADLSWGDILRDGTLTHLPRPSLLAVTMLPAAQNQKASHWKHNSAIPPHPSIVQRRMELLTSDMLIRALTLVSRGQTDRAQRLLNETRSILKGLGKGSLPPIPPTAQKLPQQPTSVMTSDVSPRLIRAPERHRTPSPASSQISSASFPSPGAIPRSRSNDTMLSTSSGIDTATVSALDAELESSLEWINHPAVFGRDSRKAVLQAIGVISSQRGYTFRTPIESLWAGRVGGVKKLAEKSQEWREDGGEVGITEES